MVISDVLVGTFLSLDEHASQAHEVNGGHGEALPTDLRFAAEKKSGISVIWKCSQQNNSLLSNFPVHQAKIA